MILHFMIMRTVIYTVYTVAINILEIGDAKNFSCNGFTFSLHCKTKKCLRLL